jgi:uncharacterized protein
MDESTDTATTADGRDHRLDPRWIRYQRQVGLLETASFALVLAGAGTAGVLLAEFPPAAVIAVAVAAVIVRGALGQWWPAVAYRHASYRLDQRTLEIRRGVLWRSVINVPRSRIQHSDVSQGPLERMHGLATLSIFTAGTRHALVRLHGVEHGRALAMRAHLMHADDDDVI